MLARAALSQLRRQVLPQQRGIASSALRLGGGKGPASDIPRNAPRLDPRFHLRADGMRKMALSDKNTPHGGTMSGAGGSFAMNYALVDHMDNSPPYYVWEEDGKTYIKGAPRPKIEEMFWEPDFQGIFPYWPRHKMHMKGNYRLNMKAEFLCFFIPTVIIFGLVMPIMMTVYAQEEAVYTTMTVKVVGRQWYWLYEVESPVEDEDEEDDDE